MGTRVIYREGGSVAVGVWCIEYRPQYGPRSRWVEECFWGGGEGFRLRH